METVTPHHLLSPPTSFDTFETMDSPDQHAFLKLEDLHHTSSPSNPLDDDMSLQATPPPVIVHSKQAKKRKSWGQELPEPTTTLPPRKRAKTDDEKEQRRIERIKRNRAAAHNSRERKRQETETLAVALARANAELDAYRKHFGSLPAGVVLPEVVTISTDSDVDTPAPSLIESHSTVEACTTIPSTPQDSLFDYSVNIKEEEDNTVDTTFPTDISPAFSFPEAKQSDLPLPLDQTQHSAAMLCDLPCRSSQAAAKIAASTSTTTFWTTLFLHLTLLQLQSGYKAILLALWTHSPSRTARLMQASTHRLTSPSTTSSTTPLLSRSTTRALAQQSNAATARVSALQRMSLIEVQRARVKAVLHAKRIHQVRASDTRAFEEQSGKSDLGSGDVDDGVGR